MDKLKKIQEDYKRTWLKKVNLIQETRELNHELAQIRKEFFVVRKNQ